MIRLIAAWLLMLPALTIAGPLATADDPADAFKAVRATIVERHALMRPGRDAGATQRRLVPVAACTMDCCCEFFEGGAKKTQCKTHMQCLEAGGICHKNSDARCN